MEKKAIPIDQLLVNHENPRFEPVGTEQEAIALMLSKLGDEVVNLAKDIAEHDLNPSKRLMVVQAGVGKYIPLEGNRRVVALRLLHKPDLATDVRFRERFKALKKESGTTLPDAIDCAIFPDRESAFRWVNLEHTGKNEGVGVVGWDREQRQRFISQYAGKKLSRSIQLIDFAKENGVNHDGVDSSTLDRLLANSDVRDLIGVSFPKGLLDFVKPKDQVLQHLDKILRGMSAGSFKVADVYTSDLARDWVSKTLGIKLKTAKATKATKPAKAQRATPKNPLDGEWISAQLHAAYPHENRVKAMLGELKGLSPRQRPNVCATSLRVLLELATYEFLKGKSGIKAIIDLERQRLIKENAKRKVPRTMDADWSPSFQMMLGYLSNDAVLMPDPLERKSLKTFIGKKSSEPFLVELNQFTHNPTYDPVPDAVTEVWGKLGKLIFRAILSGK